MKQTIAFIFARGGSKGLPGKNIRPLDGKPLIAHSITVAQQVKAIDRIIVSTDDETIAAVARDWGAETPFMRPSELAGDNSPEWKAWQHALHMLGVTCDGGPCATFVSLPATAPLRSVSDIQTCLDVFREGTCDAVVTATPAARHPMFNMLMQDAQGYARLAMPSPVAITRRQDAPPMYDMTTVAYVVRPEFIMSHTGLLEGRIKFVEIPRDRAVDIDDELDFMLAEQILAKKKATKQ